MGHILSLQDRCDSGNSKTLDDLGQKPGTQFALVDPVFNHARRGDIIVPIANIVVRVYDSGQLPVAIAKLSASLAPRAFPCCCPSALMPRNVADRAHRRPADLARPLRDEIRHRGAISNRAVLKLSRASSTHGRRLDNASTRPRAPRTH